VWTYVDEEIGRAYPGTIESGKVEDIAGNINSKFTEKNKNIVAARVNIGPPFQKPDYISYYHRDSFEWWNELAEAGLTFGTGGIKKVFENRTYLLKDEGLSNVIVAYEITTSNS
jgi:hypothetical protein